MRRSLTCLVLAALCLSAAEPTRVHAQTAKAKLAPVTPHYDAPDQPFRMAPMPQSTRSIVLPLATNLHLAFDTALLRTHTVWSGRGLALLGPQYGLPKSPFISTNDCTVLWTMPPVFPWAVGKLPEKDVVESPSWARWQSVGYWYCTTKFYYRLNVGNQAIQVVEMPWGTGSNALARNITVGPSREVLWYLAHAENGAEVSDKSAKLVVIRRGSQFIAVGFGAPDDCQLHLESKPVNYEEQIVTESGTEKGNTRLKVEGNQLRVWVRIPAHDKPLAFGIATSVDNSQTVARSRSALLSGPAPPSLELVPLAIGTFPVKRFEAGRETRQSSASTPSFRSEAFPLPKEANLLITGMDFLPNGDLAACTWPGEVWVIEGAQGSPAAAKYRRFARGLAEPMGVAVRDGKIYVATKQALYRLTDTDGNGEADLFECLNQSWGYTGSYNAFVYGPVFDKAGNFILANAGHAGRWDANYMGWGLRISPDGQKLDTICSGLREPNGIGTFGPDRDVFVSENQGAWIGACKLNHVTPGKFYGHPSAWPAKQEEYGKHTRFDPPAVWFPYKLARSVTGFAEITDDRFGPFRGQLMVGDFQNAIVTRVQLEKVNGEYQGAVWPLLKQFQSGVNRLAYGPDGKLYVGGCQAPVSWKAVAPLDFALERISYTGKLPFEVKEVHALRDGFELTFTQPVEPQAAANPDSYDVTQYGYKYHSKYGSPEIDHDGKENAASVIKVAAASVSPDKLKVRLKLEGWRTGYVTMVRSLDVKNATGESLVNDAFWYTLNQLPK